MDKNDDVSNIAFLLPWLGAVAEYLGGSGGYTYHARDNDEVGYHATSIQLLGYLPLPRFLSPSANMLVDGIMGLFMFPVVKMRDRVSLACLPRTESLSEPAVRVRAGVLFCLMPRVLVVCVFGPLCTVSAVAPGLVEGRWWAAEGASFLV